VFTLDETLKPIYKAFGIDLAAHNGVDSWEPSDSGDLCGRKIGKDR
jgi:hypothetical protein